MKLVLEITSHAGDGHVTHRSVETFPATLGRGYHNDIIIGDPHISAQHLRIDFDGKEFTIHDLGSENGMEVNDKTQRSTGIVLKSGDTLRVGRTAIRVFDPAHPVAPTQRLARTSPFLLWLARPLTVWTAYVLAIAAVSIQRYYDSWDIEIEAAIAGTAATTAICILIWSAIWGVAGKLVRHKSRFRSHVSLSSLFAILMVLATSALFYVDFLSTSHSLSGTLTFAFTATLGLALVYWSLTLATDMTTRRRRIWTGFFALGICLLALGASLIDSDRFVPAPEYSSGLQPYFSDLVQAESVESFMKGNADLFQTGQLATSDLPQPEK
jgi:pSer/pThr/pTyr-binding forkhead associated (FHA) protein